MKVALVTHWLSGSGGGVATVVESLSGALVKAGVNVRVFGLKDQHPSNDITDWTGAQQVALPTLGPRGLGFAPGLASALRDFSPNVIHTHGIWMLTSATVANLAYSNIPCVVSPHGMLDGWALQTSRLKKKIATILYERRHLSQSVCIHALNVAEAAAIKNFGLRKPIAIIPNGIHLPSEFSSVDFHRPPWSQSWGAEGKVLLFLGRLHPKKNIDGLLRAISIIRSKGALGDWRLVIAGWSQGGHDISLRNLVRELALDDRVAIIGPLYGAEKAAAFRSATAFILPSHSEGLPMTVLEAWAHGLPVAMTSACNLPEGFSARAACEIGTAPADIANSLCNFLALNQEDLNLMGQRGLKLVKENFTWPIVADRLINVYRWALGVGGVPADMANSDVFG